MIALIANFASNLLREAAFYRRKFGSTHESGSDAKTPRQKLGGAPKFDWRSLLYQPPTWFCGCTRLPIPDIVSTWYSHVPQMAQSGLPV